MLQEKAALIESIGNLLQDLSELEREKRGNKTYHQLASVKPTIIARNEAQKSLDALARLLNNRDEVCLALSYVKDKLLITNNDEEVKEYTKKHLETLRSYIQFPFKKQWEDLLIPSIIEFLRRVEYALSTKSDSSTKCLNKFLKQTLEEKEKEFSKLIWMEGNKWKLSEELKHELEKPQLNFAKVCESFKLIDVGKLISELMDFTSNLGEMEAFNPLQEVNLLANNIVNIIEGEFRKVVWAISEGNLKYLEGIGKLHAEMKILQHSWVSEIKYIGISKKCCAPCYKSLEVLGKVDKVYGTHGSTFFAGGWTPPEISNDFLAKLVTVLNEVKKDIRERKSSFLEESKNYEKVKSQLESLVKKTKLNSRDKVKKAELEGELRKLEINQDKWPYTKGSQSTAEVNEPPQKRPLLSQYKNLGELEQKVTELATEVENDKSKQEDRQRHCEELKKIKLFLKKKWAEKINDLKWNLGIAPELLTEGVEWESKLNSKESMIEIEEYAKEILRNIYQIANRELPVDLQVLESKIEIPPKN